MDHRRPFLLVTPTLDGDVLAVLARGEVELSGGELARHVGHGSTEGIRRAADRLVGQGAVLRRAAGGAHLYRLNREHLAAPYIEGLASLRGELIDRFRSALVGWSQPPIVAMLFGSVARAEATSESDLDLLVVRPSAVDADDEVWRTQLHELERSATAWTGNDSRVVEYAEDELAGVTGEPLLQDVLDHGIELFGTRRALQRLLARGRAA